MSNRHRHLLKIFIDWESPLLLEIEILIFLTGRGFESLVVLNMLNDRLANLVLRFCVPWVHLGVVVLISGQQDYTHSLLRPSGMYTKQWGKGMAKWFNVL